MSLSKFLWTWGYYIPPSYHVVETASVSKWFTFYTGGLGFKYRRTSETDAEIYLPHRMSLQYTSLTWIKEGGSNRKISDSVKMYSTDSLKSALQIGRYYYQTDRQYRNYNDLEKSLNFKYLTGYILCTSCKVLHKFGLN